MPYNIDYVPNEAEMDLVHFEVKHVRAFIKQMESDLVLSAATDYFISEEEILTIVSPSGTTIRIRKMQNGHWHYVLKNDSIRICVFPPCDVLKMIKAAVAILMEDKMSTWMLHNYFVLA